MSHIYNAGYAVVSDTTDPNSVTALQSGHTMKLAVSEDGTTIWKFVEGNPLGEKWVPALPDNVALKDEDETITGTWTFNNAISAPGGTSTEWNTAYDRSVVGASFYTSNGVYRITRQDGLNVDTDLDGRWLLFENWDTNNTDIDGLTSGSTFGKLIEGSVAGHFVLGIRSNDDNDAFYILATDNADYTGDYTEKLFEVSKNRIQYKGDNVARQGVNNNFSVGQSIIGSLDVSSNISTTNGFAQFVRNADATTPITLLKLQNQFTGQDVVYDFKLGSSKELIIEGTSASSKIISSQPVDITGTLDVSGQIKGTDLEINLVGTDTAIIYGENDAQLRVRGTNDHWSGIGFKGSTGTEGYLFYNSTSEYFHFTHRLDKGFNAVFLDRTASS